MTKTAEAIRQMDGVAHAAGLPTYSELLKALQVCRDANGVSEQRAANKTAREYLQAAS